MTLNHNKLTAAKLWLISDATGTSKGSRDGSSPRNLPYLASALYALVPVSTLDVTRMACDERWRIYINPDWLESASTPDVGQELAHIAWHLLSDHAGRARSQDVDRSTKRAWTTAADTAISHTLVIDHLRPEHLSTAADLAAPPGRSTEEYFLITSRHVDSGLDSEADRDSCGSGADGITRPWDRTDTPSLGSISSVVSEEIRRAVVIEYRDHLRHHRGTTPGGDLRVIKENLDSQLPWNLLLAGAVRRAISWTSGRGEYTYSRPSRRASVMPHVVLPGLRQPVPNVAIVIDTSASVDDELLALALGEIDGALAALGVAGAQLTVYSVDAGVHAASAVRSAKDVVLIGAGGTNMVPGIVAAANARPSPDVMVVLTDGDTPWPEFPPPGIVVVVGLLGRAGSRLPSTPPWAVRVECRVDRL